jgi:site-specific DNA-cytosine methylase
MKVLELFAGSRSIGKAFEKIGAEVFSVDINNFADINLVIDILDMNTSDVPFKPDVIWASPPCTAFSVAAIGKNWISGEVFTPKTERAELGIKIFRKTLELIQSYKDAIWYIENPRGKMRKAPDWNDIEHIRHTITYCQYGDTRMKPTDIWTNDFAWKPRKMCKNGDSCHESAPRGSRTGTQGLKGNYLRSVIPHQLCDEIAQHFRNTCV